MQKEESAGIQRIQEYSEQQSEDMFDRIEDKLKEQLDRIEEHMQNANFSEKLKQMEKDLFENIKTECNSKIDRAFEKLKKLTKTDGEADYISGRLDTSGQISGLG